MARAPNVNQLFAEQFSFRAPVTPQRLAMPPQETLQAAPVSWRDRLKDALGGVIGRHNAEMAMQVADFTPLGVAFAGNEARLAADRGGYGEAAAGAALAALPIPGARGAARAVERKALDFAGKGYRSAQIGETAIGYTVNPEKRTVVINSVKTPKEQRGKGNARAAMESVVNAADASGFRLELTPDPMDASTSKAGLTRFYSSLGFEPNKGKARDFETQSAMLRPARKVAQEVPTITTRAFHAGPAGITSFRPSESGAVGPGVYVALDERDAAYFGKKLGDAATTYALDIPKGPYASKSQFFDEVKRLGGATAETRNEVHAKAAANLSAKGFVGVRNGNESVIFDPNNIQQVKPIAPEAVPSVTTKGI